MKDTNSYPFEVTSIQVVLVPQYRSVCAQSMRGLSASHLNVQQVTESSLTIFAQVAE